jgi:hypothetical protein
VGKKLEPNKTYTVVFNGDMGHVTAVRTGPAQTKTDAPPFSNFHVMDPNLGEFNFDTTTAKGNQAKDDFLRQWGKTYFLDTDTFKGRRSTRSARSERGGRGREQRHNDAASARG